MITIHHTAAGGTLVEGTVRGDGSAEILKAAGFRWGRSIGCWFLPHSRDRAPDMYRINRAAEQLRAGGFEVAVEVDAAPRDMAEAEAERAERSEGRAEMLRARAERRDAEATARLAAADAIADRIPLGQPILVGHYSERGHRADIKRMHNHMDRFVEAYGEARHAERAAKAAGRHMAHREAPLVVARRIERLETDLRRTTAVLEGRSAAYGGRIPDGEWKTQLEGRVAHLTSQLDYWRTMRGDQIEAGRAREYSPGDFEAGDRVRVRGQWRTVARVNRTTVSVETPYSWTDRVPFHEITAHEGPGGEMIQAGPPLS